MPPEDENKPNEVTPPDVAAMAAQMAAMAAELAAIKAASTAEAEGKAAKAAEEAAAKEAEAKAKMTAAEQMASEINSLKTKLAEQDAQAVEGARTALLDALGVDPSYRAVFPTGDARDGKVKSAIERFAADHPKLITRPSGPPQPVVTNLETKMNGRPISKLLNTDAMRNSYEAAQTALQSK